MMAGLNGSGMTNGSGMSEDDDEGRVPRESPSRLIAVRRPPHPESYGGRTRFWKLLLPLGAVLALVAAACGGSAEVGSGTEDDPRVIEVSALDTLAYEPGRHRGRRGRDRSFRRHQRR